MPLYLVLYVAVTFWHSCLPVFAWCYFFLTRSNCLLNEFLAFYGVITQSVIQSFLKTPICGASLLYLYQIYEDSDQFLDQLNLPIFLQNDCQMKISFPSKVYIDKLIMYTDSAHKDLNVQLLYLPSCFKTGISVKFWNK